MERKALGEPTATKQVRRWEKEKLRHLLCSRAHAAAWRDKWATPGAGSGGPPPAPGNLSPTVRRATFNRQPGTCLRVSIAPRHHPGKILEEYALGIYVRIIFLLAPEEGTRKESKAVQCSHSRTTMHPKDGTLYWRIFASFSGIFNCNLVAS